MIRVERFAIYTLTCSSQKRSNTTAAQWNAVSIASRCVINTFLIEKNAISTLFSTPEMVVPPVRIDTVSH